MGNKYQEIERKFAVNTALWKPADTCREGYTIIKQGYLCRDPDRTVRVRTLDHAYEDNSAESVIHGSATLTIKGRNDGPVRQEIEIRVPGNATSRYEKASLLLAMCEKPIIEKHRYMQDVTPETARTRFWEIDVYQGWLKGLVLAEIELRSPDETFGRPVWLGREVTDDPRFYNSNFREDCVEELLVAAQPWTASSSA